MKNKKTQSSLKFQLLRNLSIIMVGVILLFCGIIAFTVHKAALESYSTIIMATIAVSIIAIALTIYAALYIADHTGTSIRTFVGRLSKLAQGDVTSPLAELRAGTADFQDLKDALALTIENTKAVISDTDYVLAEMANGDFTVTSKDESMYLGDYKAILSANNRIKNTLSETLEGIIEVAVQISAGASQVSSGAQSLAQGTTEQASSVQELAATINEVTEHIKKSSRDAEDANNITQETSIMMKDTIEDIEQVKLAMAAITETSNDIKKVIKAIDDIAFQTNILALNAAVEAARAGSAGKGFAVVADEVRNLSQKSSEAAKNTEQLIENAIAAVEKGSQIVAKANNAFSTVVDKSDVTSGLIKTISQQTQEQSSAIEQILIGIEQISAVVQMNSATSEESAAASVELSNQADTLKKMTSKFKIN